MDDGKIRKKTPLKLVKTLEVKKCSQCEARIKERDEARKKIQDLEEEIDILRGENVRKRQLVLKDAQCPACGYMLYTKTDTGFRKRADEDDLYCPGRKQFWGITYKNAGCPDYPHMHRHCGYCKAEWLEQCTQRP